VTVLSRCLQFNLRPLPPPLVAQHLATVLAAENIPADAGALRLLGRAARGSMRDALSLTDQAIAFGAGALKEAEVLGMLGSTPRAQALDLLDALAAADAGALVQGVDGLRAAGHGAVGALDELARWLQLIALAQAAPEALDPQDPDTPEAQRLAALWAADTLQLAYALLLQGRPELSLSPDEHAGLLMILLRVLAFRPAGDPAPSTAALRRSPAVARLTVPMVAPAPVPVPTAVTTEASRRIEPIQPIGPTLPVQPVSPARPVAPPPAPPPPPPPPPAAQADDDAPPWLDLPPEEQTAPAAEIDEPELGPAAPPASPAAALQPTPEGEAWAALFGELNIAAMARTLGMQGQCLKLERGAAAWQIQLRVSGEALRMPPGPAKLEAALTEHAGVPVSLQIEIGPVSDSPALRDADAKAQRQAAAEASVQASPELAALKRHFETTRVVPGTVRPVEGS
jgi:DNA polymerase-3 subunit gamma/tau